MEHGHREVSISVDSIRPDASQKTVERALAVAQDALGGLGKVRIEQTPASYRKPLEAA
jgi:hypothetical protein